MTRDETPPAFGGKRGGDRRLFLAALIGVASLLGALLLGKLSLHQQPAIEITGARVTPTLGLSNAIGGFMEITNKGDTPDRLLGVESKAAGLIELHKSTVTDGRARMTRIKTPLSVGPRQTVALKNGGLHLMIFDPVKPVNVGDKVPLTLVFEHAGRIDIIATAEIPQYAEHRH